jgi:hypothetical protein
VFDLAENMGRAVDHSLRVFRVSPDINVKQQLE